MNADTGGVDQSKNNGQLGQIRSWIGTTQQWSQRFSYDSIGRLSESREYKGSDSAHLTYKQRFDFDRFGNLYRKADNNQTTGQENPLPYTAIEDADISKQTNRFTAQTTYDDAGNVIQDSKFRGVNLSYDANGRVSRSTSADNTRQADSVYDASGQRVATEVDGVWTFFVYNARGQCIAEYGGVQSSDEGGVKYVLKDWQGSTRAQVSGSGYVQARADYTAFGEEINSGTGLRTSQLGYFATSVNSPSYAMTERDKATGLDHTWFRKLENNAGRWTSPDPYNGSASIGDPQRFNRYAYVQNQPTNFVDPSGLNSSPNLTYVFCEPDRWDPETGTLYAGKCYQYVSGGGMPVIGTTVGGWYPGDIGMPGPGSSASPVGNDCQRFTDRVKEIAAKHRDVRSFADELASVFTGVGTSDVVDLARTANTPGRSIEIFTSTGWKPNLYTQVSDNQARHFVGGLLAGFNLGAEAGNLVMSHNEDDQADLRVNAISISMGATMASNDSDPIYNGKTGMVTTPARFTFKGLAEKIRSAICQN
ncbi:MAG: RHS repeat domain-containing protein [Pyrinomonadaceae bacterium]